MTLLRNLVQRLIEYLPFTRASQNRRDIERRKWLRSLEQYNREF